MTGGGSERIQEARPAPSMDADRSVAAVELLQHVAMGGSSRTQLPRKSFGFQGIAHATANRPTGVGVLGFPTTTLRVRTGVPARYTVSVRRAVETSMRHRVCSMDTLVALTQPAASFGRQGSRTRTQQRRRRPGRARTSTHGASVGATQRAGRLLPGSRSKTAVRASISARQATACTGPLTEAPPSTREQTESLARAALDRQRAADASRDRRHDQDPSRSPHPWRTLPREVRCAPLQEGCTRARVDRIPAI